jgi:signal transduction histidine kinase
VRRRFRLTVHIKLALLYTGLFVVTGILLLSLTYTLLRREFQDRDAHPGAYRGNGQVSVDQNDADDADRAEDDAREEERQQALSLLWRQSLVALFIMSGIAFALGWIAAGRILSPIRQMTEHARRASASNLSERIDLRGPHDELHELAATIDDMLDRLQAAFEAQRGFAAQASHELRTPIAIMAAQAELALGDPSLSDDLREGNEAILAAAHRADGTINGLLALARSESTLITWDVIDVAELIGDTVGEYVSMATDNRVLLDLNLDTLVVSGDAILLKQAFSNLIVNAIAYNQPDGFVSVNVKSAGTTGSVTVTNSGPLVDQSDVVQLFQPFVRDTWAKNNRHGHGLGLAITRSIVTTHHGSISARARPEGGLDVKISLPVSG